MASLAQPHHSAPFDYRAGAGGASLWSCSRAPCWLPYLLSRSRTVGQWLGRLPPRMAPGVRLECAVCRAGSTGQPRRASASTEARGSLHCERRCTRARRGADVPGGRSVQGRDRAIRSQFGGGAFATRRRSRPLPRRRRHPRDALARGPLRRRRRCRTPVPQCSRRVDHVAGGRRPSSGDRARVARLPVQGHRATTWQRRADDGRWRARSRDSSPPQSRRRYPEEHLAFLIGERTAVLHVGDADPAADNFAPLASLPVADVAVLPFWYLLDQRSRAMVAAAIRPRRNHRGARAAAGCDGGRTETARRWPPGESGLSARARARAAAMTAFGPVRLRPFRGPWP